jgi:sugar phosphate isomerase/epimerase
MSITRRGILAAGLAGTAMLCTPSRPAAADEPVREPAGTTAGRPAALKFSSWYNHLSGSLPERLAYLQKIGVEGFELRSIKNLPNGIDGNPLSNVSYYQQVLRDSPLRVTALDWAHLGAMVSTSAEVREKATNHLLRAIEVAHTLQAPNLIAVPPRLNKDIDLPDGRESRKLLMETLPRLGELAAQAGTCILIEPCTRALVNCLHQVADAAAFVRDCNCRGLGLVPDFNLMAVEETNVTGAFLSGGAFVRQVHLSGAGRKMPGQGKDDEQRFREGFRGLKLIGYQGYCSFECGSSETFSNDVVTSMAFLRRIWAEV